MSDMENVYIFRRESDKWVEFDRIDVDADAPVESSQDVLRRLEPVKGRAESLWRRRRGCVDSVGSCLGSPLRELPCGDRERVGGRSRPPEPCSHIPEGPSAIHAVYCDASVT